MGVAGLLKSLFTLLLVTPVAFGQVALTTAQIAKRVLPSVVVIHSKTDSGEIQGSGFIVSKNGRIVTNLHVIKDMKTASVQLANGKLFQLISVLAIDERRDLAILQVDGLNLPTLALGNSDVLAIGEPLIIVGSPKGLEGTVTAGILSSVRDSGDGFKVLQTDAAVNPGNSGGPVVNNKGQVVGVVSFKLRSAEGLNFAIPINYVHLLLNRLHEPIPLDQNMTGLSLRETLGWLAKTIPLGSMHYTEASRDTTITLAPLKFDSCTVTFELKEVWAWDKKFERLMLTRSTIPLGALAVGKIETDHAYLSDSERFDWCPPCQH